MATAPERKYAAGARAQELAIDVGLRQYMLRVYNYMAGGLAVTGVVALVVANLAVASYAPLRLTGFGWAIYQSPLQWLIMFAPLIFALVFGLRINAMRASTAQALFWAFSAVMGLSLSWIFLVYAQASIARVFFITAGTFAATSLYGYTTRRELTGIGSFMFMGLIGLIIAMLVNIFLQSAAVEFAISVIGVIVFTGLAAWDTQRIKESYVEGDVHEIGIKKAVIGAFQLYLDFINLFIMLLRLFGSSRN
ncbi:MAG: Bax inhibitor-1/YccA family protein [Rhodospirillaceae bacterium]|nr:Bax inhibitor-1/YccA family protein [Rhodospirillaceae bacterium]